MTVDIATLAIRVESLEAQNATRELDRLTESGGRAEESTDGLTAASAKLQSILKMVAASAAAVKLYEIIKEATLLASRYNELGIVMNVVGRNAGHTAAELSATEAALQKTGISALQSRDAITKLISANIDLSMATKLARLAQDAAVIGGMNSSEAFARLVKGIQSAEKETLETMGLNVNFQKSYEALGRTLNKSAKDLTSVEKTQAAVNAVMEKAPGIAGAYEASLTNAGKQMRSMERYIENIKVQLGQPFQSPFEDLISGSTKALKFAAENVAAIRSAIESLIAAIVPAMKIAAAYFAIFVAAPAILTAVAAAFTPLIHALALYAMNVAIGQTQTLYFNRTLFGVSVSAQLAAGSLTYLGLAVKSLFGVFVGWQLGTYLNDQFLIVRVGSEMLVGSLSIAWENIRYGAVMAWEAIKYSFNGIINAMKGAYANFLTDVGNGLRNIGATETGNQIVAYADGLRKAGEAQEDFRETTRGVTAEHEKNLKVIEIVTQNRIDKEMIAAKVVQATSVAETAAVKPKKDLIELTDAQKKAYAAAVKSAKEYIDSLKIEAAQIGLNARQIKMMEAGREAVKAPTAALRMQIMQEALALEIATGAWEEKTQAEKFANEALDKSNSDVNEINEQTKALILKVKTYGMLPEAISAVQIAELEASKQSLILSEAGVSDIQRRIDALNKLAAAQAADTAQNKGLDVTKAKELLDILVAVDNATKSAADGMAESFGRVGSAIGGLTTALSAYAVQQQAIIAQLAAAKADPKNGPDKIAKLEIAAANASAQARIKSYGDMAGAAKGFFKENSRGYKALEGAEKAYRAFEMAMAIKTMLTKSGLLSAFTGLFVASKVTETAATVASVGPDVAASMVKGQAAAAAGVAAQAQGDPYSAWVRMAAMAAAMAALGFAVSGGSKKDTTAEDRQAAQGTGSVFGDKSAKSESIARSIELSATNSSIELSYTQGMLRALLGIQNSLQGLGNLLIRGSGITSDIPATTYGAMEKSARWIAGFDKILGGFVGKITGSLMNSVFGGRTTALDTGLTANRVTVGQASAGGLRASQYLDTKKDGGWFRSDKYRTEYTALGGEANAQFSKVISDMAGAIGEAGKLLGVGGDAFTQRLNNFVVDIGKISLKDLTGAQIQEQLEAVFSKVGDDMARFAVSGLQSFQRVGEGYLETLTRIAVNYSNLDSVLKSLGMTFGSTGMASIAARENLLLMTGGIDELAGKASSFADNYMTEAERLAPVRAYVEEQLGAIGLAHLKSRDAFKAHLLALSPAIDAERRQIAALFDLQDAFAKVYAGTVDLTKSQQEIADERADFQTQLDEMILTSAQLRAKERAAVDATNRGLYDQVMMQRDLKESTQAASEALKKTVDGLISTKTSSLAYRDSLLLGSLSDLTPMQKYAETQRQYAVAMAKASANPADSAAASGAQSAATAWLTASQVINASSSAFIGDKAKVLGDMDKLAAIAGVRMTDAQLQLSALDKQVAGITQLNETAAAIERALLNEHTPGAMSTPVFDVQRYGANSSTGIEVLAAEVRALRAQNADVVAELKLRRADAERQKTELVDATEGAGDATVKGVSEALDEVSYRVMNPTRVSAR